MTYDEICKMWYAEFLKAMQKRNISKEEFLIKTGSCQTNGCCYYLGTKIVMPTKLAKMCKQLNIPIEEVFSLNNPAIFSKEKAKSSGKDKVPAQIPLTAEQFMDSCIYRHYCLSDYPIYTNASKND